MTAFSSTLRRSPKISHRPVHPVSGPAYVRPQERHGTHLGLSLESRPEVLRYRQLLRLHDLQTPGWEHDIADFRESSVSGHFVRSERYELEGISKLRLVMGAYHAVSLGTLVRLEHCAFDIAHDTDSISSPVNCLQ